MEYNFREIEKKWQKQWAEMKTYQVTEDKSKEKFYVLNMFPYPSGAGLHVGHPLGYIASDIYARYKRLMGYNVLNPMGYDAYGLPAEQYAIQTGQHPAITTAENISRYRSQLDKIGFSFDWNREVRTCEPKYYKWTQWAFQKMFNSFYCNTCQKAQPIEKLIEHFSQKGTEGLDVAQSEEMSFTAAEWNAMSEKEQQQVLMNYRIAYLGETMVNWCAGLGTVLANDEVVDGVSVRGGYPVVQKKMMQWCLRVSAYAQRLLDGLDTVDWTESLKETQRNWIGRSEGTEMQFKIAPSNSPRGGEQVSLVDETSIKNKWEQFKTANPFNYDILKEYAKENRKNSTDAENALWEALRNKQLGEKFRRQHVIGDFIADFISLSSKLVIEIDGDYHNEPEQKEADLLRTKFLNEIGFTVLRFTNEEVLGNTEDVINKIKEKITFKANQSSPTGGVEGASPQPVFHRPYGARRHVHGTLDVAVSEAGEGQHKEKRVVWRQPPVALLYGGYVVGHQRAAVFNGCLKVGFLPFCRVSSAYNLLISPLSQSYYCRSLLPERVELAAQAANLSLVFVFRQAQFVYLLSVSVG